jgi:hypothetical protein
MPWTNTLRGLSIAAIAGIGGCAVGPDYHSSPSRTTSAWTSRRENGLTEVASENSHWWTSFNDAELDSLVQRAAQSNPDLRAAEARLRQASGPRPILQVRLPGRGRARISLSSGPFPCLRTFPSNTASIRPDSTPRGRSTYLVAGAAPSRRPEPNGKGRLILATV